MDVPSACSQVLSYAERGWLCFPLKPRSKIPATKRGFYEATTNPAKLHRWWGEGFSWNVGVRTGLASHLIVIDVDGAAGAAALEILERSYDRLPRTLASVTNSGVHLWFETDTPVASSVGRLGDGLDVRADGGYVAAPSSIHPDGPRYRWIDDAIPVAPAPTWLIRLAQRRNLPPLPPPPPLPPTCGAGYGRAALEREIASLSAAGPGTRNAALNHSAFRLFQLVAGGELDRGEVTQRLIAAAQANGLVDDDGLYSVRATIRSGARAGLQSPRNRAGRR